MFPRLLTSEEFNVQGLGTGWGRDGVLPQQGFPLNGMDQN